MSTSPATLALTDEDDAGLQLEGQGEHGLDNLVCVPVPLGLELGWQNV